MKTPLTLLLGRLALVAPAAAAAGQGITEPVVFFPPETPVYGAAIAGPAGHPYSAYRRAPAPPDGLADFAGDLLYPPLSTRLFSGRLSAALEARIDRYRARRNAQLNALLDHGRLLPEADEAAREQEFRAFAAVQTPALVALEAEADELRRDLSRTLLGLDAGWNSRRNWTLDSFSGARDWMNREAEFQVVRAAAFYDDGLPAVQRGLLRELATELDRFARVGRPDRAGRGDSDAMFFSPETARLRLPDRLPPALLARVGRYNGAKGALKEELRALLRQLERDPLANRASAFARLADEQWPRVVELEELAEEIRGELAPHFVPTPPARPPLPPALTSVIQAYNEDRDQWYSDIRAVMLAAARTFNPPERALPDRHEDEVGALRREAARAAAVRFQDENAPRLAELEARHAAIRSALQAIASTTRDPDTGRALDVDGLLRHHIKTIAKFDEYGRHATMYQHYRTAMLQRGLSPEQRRLLLAHAVVALAQPLPGGERLPQRTMKHPIPRADP